MDERKGFLKALEENEDDTATRMVYADWLDEQGEHEEADRQRKWPAAKKWLVQFCEKNNPKPDEETRILSYEDLLDRGRQAIAEADEEGYGFHCGNNMEMVDALQDNNRAFWRNWSIITGIPLPTDIEEKGYFSCAC